MDDLVPMTGEVLPSPDASFDDLTAGMLAREQLWLEYYISTTNATRAAELAGYEGIESTLATVGSKLRRKHDAIIRVLLTQRGKSEEDVLALFCRMLDDADMLNKVVVNGQVDLQTVADLGLMHMVKRVSTGRYGTTVEFIDRHAVATTLARMRGMLKDRLSISVESATDDDLKRLAGSSE